MELKDAEYLMQSSIKRARDKLGQAAPNLRQRTTIGGQDAKPT